MNETILLSKHQVVRHLVLFFYTRTVRGLHDRERSRFHGPFGRAGAGLRSRSWKSKLKSVAGETAFILT